MQAIKTLETKNHTYYCGYVSKYERTEAEKAELRYMIMQKSSGIIATALSIVMICNGAAPAILLTLVGLAVTFTKDHVIG